MGEPWVIVPPGLTLEDVKGVWNAEGEHIATFHDADARRRAVACVNACNDGVLDIFSALRERDERIRKLEEALRPLLVGDHGKGWTAYEGDDPASCVYCGAYGGNAYEPDDLAKWPHEETCPVRLAKAALGEG